MLLAWISPSLFISPPPFALSLSLSLSLSLPIRPYHPSLWAGFPDYILCPYRAIVSKFLLAGQHWHVLVKGSLGDRYLWVHSCFFNNIYECFRIPCINLVKSHFKHYFKHIYFIHGCSTGYNLVLCTGRSVWGGSLTPLQGGVIGVFQALPGKKERKKERYISRNQEWINKNVGKEREKRGNIIGRKRKKEI